MLVLGLEAPAFAVPPTVSSVSPNSGPVGCVVVITGTNFNNPNVDTVEFGGVAATDFSIISGTEIWATVPVGAVDGPIMVENLANEQGFSPAPFDVTATAGGCAPTITSFTPTCGLAGATVAITGTNLLQDAGGTATSGGDVFFAPYGAGQEATHSVPVNETPTTLSVLVPSGASDGPLRVTTFAAAGGTAFSATAFEAPPPDCVTEPEVTEHSRSVTLRLRKHLIARGNVTVSDDFAACAAGVRVKIQRKVSGGWRGVGATTTNDNGGYRRAIQDKPGNYRAIAKRVSLNDGADICLPDTSPRVRHSH